MRGTWVTAMEHFVIPADPPVPVSGPAARLAAHLGAITGAATVAPACEVVQTALPCRRRPGRRRCEGRILLQRQERPPEIRWVCPLCDDNGIITRWEGTPWDLTRRPDELSQADQEGAGGGCLVFLTESEYGVLRSVPLLDVEAERMVLGARLTAEGVRLEGPAAVLEELLDTLAAESNAAPKAARRRELDAVYERLTRAVAVG